MMEPASATRITFSDRMLFIMELKEFFAHRRSLHFLPLAAAGIIMMVWAFRVAAPFTVLAVILFAGMELQFNNMFFRTPREFDALCLLPLEWGRVVIIKNLVTVLLSLFMLALLAAGLLYFSPERIDGARIGEMILFTLTVLFPLVHTGNIHSLRYPRRLSGWQMSDAFEIVWMLVNLVLASLPYVLFVEVLEMPFLALLYAVGTVLFWYHVTVPRTVALLQTHQVYVCSSK